MKQVFSTQSQANLFRKTIATFVTIFFLLNQTIPAMALPVQQDSTAVSNSAVKSFDEPAQAPQPAPVTEDEAVQSSQDFLSDELSLEELPAYENQEEEQNAAASSGEEAEAEQTFEQAVDHFASTENSAIAVIRNLTLENLTALAGLGYEVGLAIVDGILVAFTSHDETQIRAAEVLKNLFDGARTTFLAHFQPGTAVPSYVDQVGAADRGNRTEYAAGAEQVRSYNADSVDETVYTYADLYAELQKWIDQNPAQDKLNTWATYFADVESIKDLILYRSSPPDIYPNKPVLQFFNGGGAPFMSEWNAQPSAASMFKLDYDVTAGFQGAVMNFTAGLGAADLTGAAFSTLSFNVRHNVQCNAADDCMKVEFQDTDGDTVVVTFKELGFNPSASFSQLNISRSFLQGKNGAVNFGSIRQINFVVGNFETDPDTGFFEIETGSLAFNPIATTTSDAVTTFGAIRPTINEIEPCSVAGQNPCTSGTLDTVTALTVDAHNHYSFSYNLGNGTDAAGRFAATNFNLNGQLINTNTTPLVFGLKGTGTTGGKIRIEVIDNNGDKVVIRVETLSTSFQKFKITKALLDSSEVPGFDATQVANIVFVVDPGTTGSNSAIGTIEVNTDGLAFTPTAEETANAVTDFSSKQPTLAEIEPCSVAGQNPCTSGTNNTITSLVQDSPDHYAFGFNLGNGNAAGRFGATLIDFGSSSVNSTSGIVLGLKGTGTTGGKMKLEFIDASGDKVTVNVTGITGSFKNFRVTKAMLDLAGIANFDGTAIKQIVLVVDPGTTGSDSAIGTFDVNTDGLFFSPVAELTGDAVTNFSTQRPTPGPLEPCSVVGQDPCTSGTLDTVTAFNQDSHAHYSFNFDLGNGSDTGNRRFAGSILDFGAQRFNTTGNPIVLGLKGTGTNGNLKIEVVDTNNRKVIVTLNGLTDSFQNFKITKALLESAGVPSYDATQIRLINIVVDNTTTGDSGAEGTVEVNTSGMSFPVVATETTDAVTNFNAKQPTVGELEPCATNNQNPCTSGTLNTIPTFNQPSPDAFDFTFDLGNGSSGANDFRRFGGALIGFGSGFFDTTGNAIVLGLKASGTTKIKLDIVDNNGDTISVLVQGLTSSFKKFKITKAMLDAAGVANFDATQISAIVLVVDDNMTGSPTATGSVNVNTDGLKFIPTATTTGSAVTDFGAKQPVAGELEPCATAGQDPCTSGTLNTITAFTQDTADHFSFDYDLSNGSSSGFRRFGGAIIGFDSGFFNTTGAPIILGLKGTGTTGGKMKIEVVDNNGDKVTVNITGLTGSFQNYQISKALLESAEVPGFDATQIASIVLVVDDTTTGSTSATGTIDVNTDGLKFSPTAVVTGNAVTDFGAKQPTAGELEPCSTIGQDPCTDGTLNTITSFTQDSADHLAFNYDLGNGQTSGFRRFGGALIGFGTNFFNTTGNAIILGLKGTGTTKLKIDVVDASGDKVTVQINGLTNSFQNYQITKALLESAGVPNFDATQIASIVVVVDNAVAGSNTASGAIEINTDGLKFSPTAPTTSNALTDFGALQPTAGELEPCSTIGQDPCTDGTLNTITSFTQDSADHLAFNYDLGNGSTSGFRRFGGALIGFDNTLFNTTGNPIVLGLKGTGATNLKVDVVDASGDKVTVNITGLTNSFQKYQITKALLESAGVPNFDATQIKAIVVVIDNAAAGSDTASGTVEINTDGLKFSPNAVVTGNAVTDFSTLQPTAGELEPCSTIGQDPCTDGTLNTITSFTQDSADHLAFDYDLGNGQTSGFRRFGGALIGFGPTLFNPTGNPIVLGLKGSGTTKLKIDVVDASGDKVTVNVTGLTGSFQNYQITKALLDSAGVPNFDSTQIASIVVVVDDAAAGSTTATGTIEINTDGLKFSPTAPTTSDAVTDFGAKQPTAGELEPCATAGQDPCTSGTLNTVTAFTQDSADHFAFNYDLGNGSSTGFRRFAGALIGFGSNLFDTTSTAIVLGLKGTGTTKLKVDVVDAQGQKVTVNITGLTNSFQKFKITKALLDSAGVPDFDADQIASIVVVVDNVAAGSDTASGAIEVNTDGLKFSPTANTTANPVTDFGALQPVAGALEPCATAGQDPCTSGTLNTVTAFTQDSADHVAFDYDLGNGSSTGFRRFAGTLIGFDNGFFNTTGNPIVLGLKGSGTTKLKIDVVDASGDKVTVNVIGLTGSFQNFEITQALLDSAGVPNFDATQIKAIVVVVDNAAASSDTAAGTIEINTDGLKFSPTAGTTTDPVTNFSAQRPTPGALEPCATAGQDPCTSGTLDTVTSFTQDSKTHFNFAYNLGNGSDTGFRRFAGGIIGFGANLFDATSTPIILGLKGTGTSNLKIDVVDDNGDKVTVNVTGLTASFQNYIITKTLLDSAGVAGFDASKIASIVVVVDNVAAGSDTATGTIDVNSNGLYFEPSAVETTDPVRKFTALRPGVGELEPCATAGQDPCTSGTLNTVTNFSQPSGAKFIFDYDLGNGSDTGFRRFAGALLNFAPNSADGGYVFGLKGTGTTGGKLKLVFTDESGDSVTIRINSLTSGFKNFKITETLLNSAGNLDFDSNNVAAVSFVVDEGTTGSPTATGHIEVNTGGLNFEPTAVETTDPVRDLSFKQPGVGALEPCATAGQNPCTSGTLDTVTAFNQPAHTDFNFDFDLGNGSDTGFRRFGGALLNFAPSSIGGGFVFGLKGTGTVNGNMKVVFTDINGKQVTVKVTGLTGSYKNFKFTNALLKSAGVTGFDPTQVAAISFVVDSITTGSNTATGNIAVKTKGVAFVPVAVETTNALKDLSFKRPSVGELEPCATAGQNPCTSGTLDTVPVFTQTDSDHFDFTYDLANGSDAGFRRFGGALLNFGTNPVSAGFVFGLKGEGTTGGKLKLVFTDINNKQITVLVTNLTDTFKRYEISNALLLSAGIPGFKTSSIKAISIVVDDGTTGSGTAAGKISVETKGVAFDPTAPTTADAVTDFDAQRPNTAVLEPCATAFQDPCTSGTLDTVTNFIQDSRDHFKFDFNLGNGFDSGFRRFAGTMINFGTNYFDTNSADIILGLKGTGETNGKAKLEIVDNLNRKVTVKIEGLTSSFQNFKITQALLLAAGVRNFDPSKIAVIAVVVDNNTTGSSTATGTIEVNTDGLNFEPAAIETTDLVTDFQPKQPVVGALEPCATANQDPCTSGTLDTVTSFTQGSRNSFKFNYNLGNGSDTGFRRFAGAILNFGTDFVDATSDIVLGLKGSGTTGRKLKLEFIDDSGNKVIVRIADLPTGLQNFKITKAILDSAEIPGFDATKIASIVFVVDPTTTGSSTATGTIEVATKGMKFSPLAVVTADPISDFSSRRPVAGELEPCATANENPCTSGTLDTITAYEQLAQNHLALDFDLGNGSDSGFRRFGGALINFGTNTYSAAAGAIVLALKGTGTSKLAVEFVDASGDKVRVRIEGLTSSFQNFKMTKTLLDSAGVPGFDSTAIASIVVVIDDVAAGSPTAAGDFDIQVAGLDFVPRAEETADAVTDLSAKQPFALVLEPCATANQDPCTSGSLNTVTSFTQDTTSHFSLDYDLANGDDNGFRRFAGALLEFGSNTYDTTTPLVLGFKGTGTTGGQLKLDFVDVNGKKVTVIVENLTGTFKNFKISKTLLEAAGIVGFDATQIKTVAIVVDPTTTGSSTAAGTIEVNTQGLHA